MLSQERREKHLVFPQYTSVSIPWENKSSNPWYIWSIIIMVLKTWYPSISILMQSSTDFLYTCQEYFKQENCHIDVNLGISQNLLSYLLYPVEC